MMMVGLKQKRSGELFGASYEGRRLLLGKSWARQRAYHRQRNRATGGFKRRKNNNKGDKKGGILDCSGCILSLKSKDEIIMVLISPSILPRKQILKRSTLKFIVISYRFFYLQAREGLVEDISRQRDV